MPRSASLSVAILTVEADGPAYYFGPQRYWSGHPGIPQLNLTLDRFTHHLIQMMSKARIDVFKV